MSDSSSALIAAHRVLCAGSYAQFVSKMFAYNAGSPYVMGVHHHIICDAMARVTRGEIRKLIINIAPRYGKTVLVSQYFPAYGLTLNPRSRFLMLSYSSSLAEDNSMATRAVMESEYYQLLFPIRIEGTRNRWRTGDGGGLYSTTMLGQITGFGAGRLDSEQEEEAIDEFTARYNPDRFGGAIIIDDPIKPEDALSDTVRERVNHRFESTIRNRVNSRKTPIVIIMQRLHPHDLCGYLMETEPNEWSALSLPCITTDANGRECALWPFKHSLAELKELARVNPFVFETQYMQNPQPLQGLMYERGFREYEITPTSRKRVRKCYIDTADTGGDYLCAIVYDELDTGNYIVDVLYTDKPMEYTEEATAEMLTKHAVERCNVESNNGGRGFCRNVEAACRRLGNSRTAFCWFAQTANKQVRIFSHSADVQNLTFMPKGWRSLFPAFASAILGYMKTGGNAHDDAPDALTGTVEKRQGAGIDKKKISNLVY